jgi:hypothetical protein
MASADGSGERVGRVMDAMSQDAGRRAIGQHIGAGLRHARTACELNLRRASLDAIQHEVGKAIDCLRLAWNGDGGRDA